MNPVVQVAVTRSGVPDINRRIAELTRREVVVGVPAKHATDNSMRIAAAKRQGGTAATRRRWAARGVNFVASKTNTVVNNAMIAFVQDQGSPLRGIPAREFMRTGVRAGQQKIVQQMEVAGHLALDGKDVSPALIAVGLEAQSAIRAKITAGPFAPLKPSTLAARRARGRSGTKPLIDTGQLRQAINFEVREKK